MLGRVVCICLVVESISVGRILGPHRQFSLPLVSLFFAPAAALKPLLVYASDQLKGLVIFVAILAGVALFFLALASAVVACVGWLAIVVSLVRDREWMRVISAATAGFGILLSIGLWSSQKIEEPPPLDLFLFLYPASLVAASLGIWPLQLKKR